MSQITDAWNNLYAVQTEIFGPVTATIGVAIGSPAIVDQVPLDQVLRAGGLSEAGQFELQMRASDFGNLPPPKLITGVQVTGLGMTTEAQLVVLNCKVNNGIYYIAVGDITAEDA